MKRSTLVTVLCLGVTVLCLAALVLSSRSGGDMPQVQSVDSSRALAEYSERPAVRAAQAWADYVAQYDADGSRRAAAAEAGVVLDARYALYSAYTPEMCEKLSALAAENGLSLYESMSFCYAAGELGRGELLGAEDSAVGYLYNDGSFHLDVTLTLNDASAACRLDGYRAATFSEALPLPAELSAAECWYYETQSGAVLLLLMGTDSARALWSGAEELVFLTVDDPALLSAAALEALCERVDWSLFQ